MFSCEKQASTTTTSTTTPTSPRLLLFGQTQRILEDQQFKMQKRMEEMKEQEAERQRKVCVLVWLWWPTHYDQMFNTLS